MDKYKYSSKIENVIIYPRINFNGVWVVTSHIKRLIHVLILVDLCQ